MKKTFKAFAFLIISLALVSCGEGKKSDDNAKTQKQTKIQTTPQTTTQVKLMQAPAFTLKNSEGQDVSIADFKGKVVILNFWATWCPPCRQEIPDFIKLQSEYGEKGFQMVGISADQNGWKVVKPFMKEQGINYPILLTDDKTYKDYQALLSPQEQGGIPFTFIIDQQGNIQDKLVGYRDKSYWLTAIKPLLEKN